MLKSKSFFLLQKVSFFRPCPTRFYYILIGLVYSLVAMNSPIFANNRIRSGIVLGPN